MRGGLTLKRSAAATRSTVRAQWWHADALEDKLLLHAGHIEHALVAEQVGAERFDDLVNPHVQLQVRVRVRVSTRSGGTWVEKERGWGDGEKRR